MTRRGDHVYAAATTVRSRPMCAPVITAASSGDRPGRRLLGELVSVLLGIGFWDRRDRALSTGPATSRPGARHRGRHGLATVGGQREPRRHGGAMAGV